MSLRLSPYIAYKDSGVEWLGQIPAHWQCLPHRALFSEVIERDHPDEPMLSVTISRGVIQQADLLADSSKKDSSNENKASYKLVEPGDIAYNKMRAWQGAVGVSKHRGIISPAYIVVRPRMAWTQQGGNTLNTDYFHYLLRTPAFATEAERWSYGITSDQWSLRADDFKRIYNALPPRDEQDAIVRFLEHTDHRVNRLIKAKRRLIELLHEQKQAVIHRAVTVGLDPDALRKPSGVDWLGDIPAHWAVKPLTKLLSSIVDYRGKTPNKTESGVFLITTKNIRNGFIDYERSKEYVSEAEYHSTMSRGLPAIGDVLFTMEAPLGEVAIVDREHVALAQRIIKLRTKKSLNPYFLRYAIMERCFQNQLQSKGTGSTALGIKASKLNSLRIVVPPDAEQTQIISYIEQETVQVNAAIDKAKREVELIREYRTRLIADVVTGKVDVRGVAFPVSEAAAEWENIGEEIETDDEEADALDEGEVVADADP